MDWSRTELCLNYIIPARGILIVLMSPCLHFPLSSLSATFHTFSPQRQEPEDCPKATICVDDGWCVEVIWWCGVFQGTSSRWIWAKYMHLSGLEYCGEKKEFESLVYVSELVFQTQHLNLTSDYHPEIFRHPLSKFLQPETLPRHPQTFLDSSRLGATHLSAPLDTNLHLLQPA